MLGFMVLEAGWLLAGAEELLLGPEGREPASKREHSLALHTLSSSSCQTAALFPPYSSCQTAGKSSGL